MSIDICVMEANEAFSLKHHKQGIGTTLYLWSVLVPTAFTLSSMIVHTYPCACIEHGLAKVACVTSKSNTFVKKGPRKGATKIVQ